MEAKMIEKNEQRLGKVRVNSHRQVHMTLRRQIVVVAVWLVSVFAGAMVGLYAQGQLPPVEPRLPRSVAPSADVISGADLGFRVDSRKGRTPVGRLVVRIIAAQPAA